MEDIVMIVVGTIFMHDIEHNRKFGHLGIISNILYCGMIILLTISGAALLFGAIPVVQVFGFLGCVSILALFMAQMTILFRFKMAGSTKQSLQWLFPNGVVALWVFALCYRVAELGWPIALLSSAAYIAFAALVVWWNRAVDQAASKT